METDAKNDLSPHRVIRTTTRPKWRAALRWVRTSSERIAAAENELLSTLVKTRYVQEQVNIGSGPSGSKVNLFGSPSEKPKFINTLTFDGNESSPVLVLVHGFAASCGFFFRNFDTLAEHFRVIAIDLLGWGGSSRPNFSCRSTEETDAWFIESLEEWRVVKGLDKFILLGHSLGGYISAKYALKYPEHIKHLILVGPAGFTLESVHCSEQFTKFKGSWKGTIVNQLWESNFTPQKFVRGLGPWGRNVVHGYIGVRFGTSAQGMTLTEEEINVFSDYVYHTTAAKASGELCLKYIFSFGAFARKPLLGSSDWKVPISFIYGCDDWMDYRGAQQARQCMDVACEIIRVPKAGHFVFIDNPTKFHSAVLYCCRDLLNPGNAADEALPEGLASA